GGGESGCWLPSPLWGGAGGRGLGRASNAIPVPQFTATCRLESRLGNHAKGPGRLRFSRAWQGDRSRCVGANLPGPVGNLPSRRRLPDPPCGTPSSFPTPSPPPPPRGGEGEPEGKKLLSLPPLLAGEGTGVGFRNRLSEGLHQLAGFQTPAPAGGAGCGAC